MVDVYKGFWLDRSVLVTGGTGLLGSRLVKELVEHGAQVVCLLRDWVPQSNFFREELDEKVVIVDGDVVEQDVIERTLGEYEIETVFHLAAQTIVGVANKNPISTFESNIQGTWSLLEACRRSPGVQEIVVASSDKAYGDVDKLPYTEETPLKGEHPYDVSKSCADLICRTYFVSYGLPVCVTRCGNFFGEGDLNWNRIVPGTIRSVVRGQRPIIRSDGSFIRDYFYVGDGAHSYMHLAAEMNRNKKIWGEAFNFSNETQVTVLSLTNKILKLMHKDGELSPEIKNEASNEIIHQSLSAKKAKDVLKWSSKYDMDEALKNTIAWYKEFLSDGDS